MNFTLRITGENDCAVVVICNLYKFFDVKYDIDSIKKDIGYCKNGTERPRLVHYLYKNFDIVTTGYISSVRSTNKLYGKMNNLSRKRLKYHIGDKPIVIQDWGHTYGVFGYRVINKDFDIKIKRRKDTLYNEVVNDTHYLDYYVINMPD